MVTSGTELFLLFLGLQFHSRTGWMYCLGGIALLSLFAWQSALRRHRAIRDTPTSKISAAAQGYVELIGTGAPFANQPLYSKLHQLPCIWYRYLIEKKDSDNKWKREDSGETTDSFVLKDETGECVIDPDKAEIVTQHRSQWQENGYRYTEWTLLGGDRIYAIGEFRTLGGNATVFDSRVELDEILTEWKKDMPALTRRFDSNGDGKIDLEEWAKAREEALREVEKRRMEVLSMPEYHEMVRPADGRPYLLSNLSPERLSRRYLYWSWGHTAIFLGTIAGMGWMLQPS